jgi:2-dehydropantoate 2-reductase
VRIAIIGAGAVGGTMAGLLDRAGHDVTVTARGAHLDSIRDGGIRLAGAWGEHVALVRAIERLDAAADLLVVTTKAQDAAAALDQNRAAWGSERVLVVQNGLAGIATAARVTGRTDVAGGLAMYAASYLSPGTITVTTSAVTYLGGPDGPARAIAAALSPAMPVHVLDDLDGALWSKLVVNMVNAVPAITGLHVQEVAADRGLSRVVAASMRETVRVAHASGIRFASISGLSDRLLTTIAALPDGVAAQLPRRMAARMGTVPNPGSTLQSIRRGQRTEIDYLNGAVSERGRTVGVATPINDALVTLVHEVESAGSFLSAEDVVRRVRAAR